MTNTETLVSITSIVVLGVGAQWAAAKLRLPSILLLLATGLLLGPGTNLINPDALFGQLLFPLVSLSVAIILFEGGLSLRIQNLEDGGKVLIRLLSVGMLVTWLLTTIAAKVLLGFSTSLALLFGAILVVTGPTVVGPLLRHIRPSRRVSSLAEWEGIVIDPIGVLLTALVFEGMEVFTTYSTGGALFHIIIALVKSAILGTALGYLAARVLSFLLSRYLIPDQLHSAVTMMFLLLAYTGSELVQREAGLFAVTIMGIVLANQRYHDIRHISEFKENLRVLLLAALFILLSARVSVADITSLNLGSLLFVATLILIIRPISVFLATFRTDLPVRERIFLAFLAPRGIVAATVASLFALRLGDTGAGLVSNMFVVISGTVLFYGLFSAPLARMLGLSNPNPQGTLFVGGGTFSLKLAKALADEGYFVLVIDTNWNNISQARMLGLHTLVGDALSERTEFLIPFGEVGRLLAVTSSDEVNTLVSTHYRHLFGRQHVFQIPYKAIQSENSLISLPSGGRTLFAEGVSLQKLEELVARGAVIKKTSITQDFSFAAYLEHYKNQAIPLFIISPQKTITVCAAGESLQPSAGSTIISLIPETLLVSA